MIKFLKTENILIVAFIFLSFNCNAQIEDSLFNFGFETQSENHDLPNGWFKWGDYSLSIDTVCKTGHKSGKITSLQNGTFGCIAISIPAYYEGGKIELEGFIKTENVKNGFAGLLLRIDGYGDILAFDNMHKMNVSGTNDWEKYSIKLDYPVNADKIIVGGILTGSGQAWFDEFNLFIDGKNIRSLSVSDARVKTISENDEAIKNSNFSDSTLTVQQIDNLKVLGLIWGFLKYYHPNVAKGDYNWDNELFKQLPKVLYCESDFERDIILSNWIVSLGEIEESDTLKFDEDKIKQKPDLDWITNSDFSKELESLLLEVKNSKRSKKNFYIDMQLGVGNPEFKNELKYSTMSYPNAGFRLLALYRYWNIIQYFFPNKCLIEEDWKDVLVEFIPEIINAKDDVQYTLAILELIARIHDTHANLWGWSPLVNHFGTRYANVKLTFVEEQAVVTGFYLNKPEMNTNLELGDVVLRINNIAVEEIVNQKLIYTPASNYPTQLRDISTNLFRSVDTTISVEFMRNGETESLILKTYPSTEIFKNSDHVPDTCFKLINKDIAYIDNGELRISYLPQLWKTIRKTKGLIIDLRNYPSDFPIYALSSYLMPQSTVFVKFSQGNVEYPGLFTYSTTNSVGKTNKNYYKGKVVILVNEITQSSSEFHAMAYRVHPNAIVIGSTTSGADGNVSEFYLPGGLRTMISGIGVYYPDGSETQRVGIVPDIFVKPTITGIKEGRDEVLEKAIEIVKEE